MFLKGLHVRDQEVSEKLKNQWVSKPRYRNTKCDEIVSVLGQTSYQGRVTFSLSASASGRAHNITQPGRRRDGAALVTAVI